MIKIVVAIVGALTLQFQLAHGQNMPGIKLKHAQVRKGEDDIAQVELLLNLALRQIEKPGELKKDIDSAWFFIEQAKKINSKLRNNKCNGLISLTLAKLNEKCNDKEIGEDSATSAVVSLLKTNGNYSLLGDAYLETGVLCPYDNFKKKHSSVYKAILFYHKAADIENEANARDTLLIFAENEKEFVKAHNLAEKLSAKLKPYANDTAQLQILLKLATLQITKPGRYKADLDSGLVLINQAKKLNDKLKNNKYAGLISITLALLEENRKNWDLEKKRSEEAISIFTNDKINYSLLADAYLQLSKFYLNNDNYKEWQKYVNKAIYLFHADGNLEGEANTLVDAGYSNHYLSKEDNAYVQLKSAVSFKSLSYKKKCIAYKYLADISNGKSDFPNEFYFLLEGRKYLDNTIPLEVSFAYYYQLSQVTEFLKYYDQGIMWAQKGADLTKLIGDNLWYYSFVHQVIVCFLAQGKYREALNYLEKTTRNANTIPGCPTSERTAAEDFGRIYFKLKQYKKAEQYYEKLDLLFKTYDKENAIKNNQYYQNLAYHLSVMANFYIRINKYDKAKKYVDVMNSRELKKVKYPPNVTVDLDLTKFKVDSATGKYISAIRCFKEATVLNSLIHDNIREKQISELIIKYEASEKDQNIRILQSQGSVQKVALQKISLQRNITLAGVCTLLIITAFAFNAYRIKKRSNLILQIKQKKINQQNILLELLVTEKDNLLFEKEELLGEKEILMREIHHRVKNNLHMISSLLESQSAYLENEALLAIQKSQHRVQAISLIHQKLYVNDKVTHVLMSVYLREIVSYLRDSFVTDVNIKFNIDIDPIKLDVAQAVPVGLIVNEVITNSIKYAFPLPQNGIIEISMKQKFINQIVLAISDNGIGLSKGFNLNDEEANNSLGMNLIKGLSKNLQGTINIKSEAGTKIELTFFNDDEMDPII